MRVYHSTCPCKGCTYRELGCHSNCKNPEKTYDEWKKDSIAEPPVNFFETPMMKKNRRRNAIRRELYGK